MDAIADVFELSNQELDSAEEFDSRINNIVGGATQGHTLVHRLLLIIDIRLQPRRLRRFGLQFTAFISYSEWRVGEDNCQRHCEYRIRGG